MRMNFKNTFFLLALVVLASACGGGSSSKETVNTQPLKAAPQSSADSLYAFVEKQVAFGPRVPNTDAHTQAADWFVSKFESYGANVMVQEFEDNVYDGTRVSLKNVIASFYPEKKKRILLAAHWDTRPFADKDSENKEAPIDGANDGGSGVAVLLEIARVLSTNNAPNVGVDIILFDGEDWGEHQDMGQVDLPAGKESWWCLGSQYWSKNKHKAGYTAYYGILLDMVGASDATFYYDSVSQQNAGRVMSKVWNTAHRLGYQNFFKKSLGATGLMDDHVFVNKYAKIPMIDILDYRPDNFFGDYHHTQADNMDVISKETLKAVTQVVLTTLYNE
ncbi:DUF4910 domain-containing protein [Roseivirga pacifica]|nr:DUF4910 domain-containing protein [Roseivirga pacifica]MCO6366792.1 DUF4910 domain-containing protein [Roseivirga pacifica]MCO6370676.1 DUF4910 domain-containing protein [Roseivirga pacifica]MCO6374448.1 DUF4910 domain-containing protein [Roseivirga pacifica]MCO6379707.1 DUF4910 domain-containing protein [Roseivirga pacifica]